MSLLTLVNGKIATEVLKMGRDMANRSKWVKSNIIRYVVDLNRSNEKDIIDKLESVPNKKQYIISLIKKDIENEKSANQ